MVTVTAEYGFFYKTGRQSMDSCSGRAVLFFEALPGDKGALETWELVLRLRFMRYKEASRAV